MLEKIPSVIGEALSGLKAGREKTAYHTVFTDVPETLTLTSSAFIDGADMPACFTADGEGLSPPLAWTGLPAGTVALVVLVEDAGSPTPQPLVHLIAWDVAPSPGRPGGMQRMGRNSFLRPEWLPPDPPRGHGRHDYVLQIYAMRQPLHLTDEPGRGAVIEAMQGHVLAKGHLIGAYARP
jgi:phosphatidylethanolamine-binding protein (PEBP) family uncharacterized protein